VRSPTLRLSATQRSQRDDREVGHSSEASQQSRAVIPTTEAESRRQSARPASIGIIRESEQSTLFRVRNSCDLLLFHAEQVRYVVVELKVGKFRHEFAGQLAFYVTMVDDQLRHPDRHAPTVGILLCGSSKEQVVRYALRSANAPMAIATYTYDALPPAEQAALPPAEAITAAFAGTGELTVTARIEATGVVEDGPDGPRP